MKSITGYFGFFVSCALAINLAIAGTSHADHGKRCSVTEYDRHGYDEVIYNFNDGSKHYVKKKKMLLSGKASVYFSESAEGFSNLNLPEQKYINSLWTNHASGCNAPNLPLLGRQNPTQIPK